MTTQELTKEVVDMKAAFAGLGEKMSDACARLVIMEREVKEQGKLLQSIDKLAMGITRLDERISELGQKVDVFGGRLNGIELEPAMKWKNLIADLIKLIVAAAVGFGLAKIGLH